MDNMDIGRELDWDDEIENEGEEFELLPEGTYDYTVESFERGRFSGSEKMAACNSANLRLQVFDPVSGRHGVVFDTLYLNSKAEWRISQFFLSIGQKKKGEAFRPNWNLVSGSSGKLEVSVNKYTDKNGNQRENNRVTKYLPQAEPGSFKPGEF